MGGEEAASFPHCTTAGAGRKGWGKLRTLPLIRHPRPVHQASAFHRPTLAEEGSSGARLTWLGAAPRRLVANPYKQPKKEGLTLSTWTPVVMALHQGQASLGCSGPWSCSGANVTGWVRQGTRQEPGVSLPRITQETRLVGCRGYSV